ncbi:type II secretion system protein [Mucisphaera calidilacus]|uniref:Prepilin-type N-terminal cleavage/methylation domain-containing protein n=1 Tax=Mucisphaera calidilacus TaxID=2527982 RepID=A0A518BYV5_9BACT|nr:prepilin-type N-terminal cleavage/methylation domain-containing protein [Mucisphaera calidilacus]QDU72150.1 hypothetical protein Pan265_20130 [Mucisphaera calidilacus]
MRPHAFTLIELIVVISIIALLIGILLPSLAAARHSARAMQCLSNIRQMEIAHYSYTHDNKGHLIRANLAHGGVTHGDFPAWFLSLSAYYGSELVVRSPLDESEHWGPFPQGEPIPNAPTTQRRQTSYGINNFLDVSTIPYGPDFQSRSEFPYYTMANVHQTSSTVHFLIMAFEGRYAGADHPHVESWFNASYPTPAIPAQQQVQINAVRGEPQTDGAVSNWGFLDGHAESVPFGELVTDVYANNFDPSARH